MSDKGNKRVNRIKSSILEILREKGRVHTKAMASLIDVTLPTASKYLGILEGEKKIKKDDNQPPYLYWSLKEDKDNEQK